MYESEYEIISKTTLLPIAYQFDYLTLTPVVGNHSVSGQKIFYVIFQQEFKNYAICFGRGSKKLFHRPAWNYWRVL
jgi:hypothetical protein